MNCRFSPALAALLLFPIFGNAASPVSLHGKLSIREGGLVGEFTGKKVRLVGMSLGNLGAEDESSHWNRSVVDWLATDWGCSVVRASMDISQISALEAYRNNPNLSKAKIHQLIQGGIERGIYVVVSWHEDSLSDHPDEAKDFFEEMAMVYGNKPNVLFEPYDGLSGKDYDWNRLRKLHEEILAVIRSHSSNVVIVSTPRLSRESDAALASPLVDANVLYSQRLDLQSDDKLERERVRKVTDAKLPVFVSQLSTSSAAEAKTDIPKASRWKDFLDTLGVSWCGWSISKGRESSATLVSSASQDGSWSATDLTASGAYFRSALLADIPSRARYDTLVVPGKIDGRAFSIVAFDHALRAGTGGRVQLDLLPGSWAQYVIASPTSQTARLLVRASVSSVGTLIAKLDGKDVARFTVTPGNDGPSAVALATDSIRFEAGTQLLRLEWTSDDTGRLVVDQLETDPRESPVNRKGPVPAKWNVKSTSNGLEIGLSANAQPVEIQVADLRGRILAERILTAPVSLIPLQDRGVLVIRAKDAHGSASWTLMR
ncbi:MAG: cellulase family glycosylhydrolase [Fibrobacterota bacterium]|nr:MAG: cellulase family glycosylhydrolase [Fibrobacterota bacterium]